MTAPERSHVSHVVGDSDWELTLCEVLEHLDEVRAYAKNHALNFEVPYAIPGGGERRYRPDFVVKIDDGRDDLLNVGFRRGDAALKAEAMRTHWVPAVNNDGRFGRWGFIEISDIYASEDNIRAAIRGAAGGV